MTPTTRLPKESVHAHAAFKMYLDMGTTRSIARVSQECCKNASLINRWSQKWKWQERLLTAAADQADIDRQAKIFVAVERERELQRRKWESEDLAYKLFTLNAAKLETMLKWPLSKTVINQETGQTIITPINWRLADTARMGSWQVLLAKVMTGGEVTVGDIRAANENKTGTANMPAATGTPGVIIHIEGGEDDEDEIVYLPDNVTKMPPQGGTLGTTGA